MVTIRNRAANRNSDRSLRRVFATLLLGMTLAAAGCFEQKIVTDPPPAEPSFETLESLPARATAPDLIQRVSPSAAESVMPWPGKPWIDTASGTTLDEP